MFFVFQILLLIFYISTVHNYVLKKKHVQEEVINLDTQNDSIVFSTHKPLFQIIQDLTNTKNPNLKLNVFDKRLSDEMFSIKQHVYEKDIAYTAPNLVNPKTRLATSTLELKQKWPIVDLLFQADNIPGSLQYIDEFENMYLINSTLEQNQVSSTDNTIAVKNDVDREDQHKEKDKVVGLRSLSANVPSHMPGRMYHSIAIKQCTCAKTNPTTTPNPLLAGITQHKCTQCSTTTTKDCTRKIVSSSILPCYLPYGILSVTTDFPTFYYPPNVFNDFKTPKPCKHHKRPRPFIEDDLYYDDSFEREKYDNDRYDNEDADDDYLQHEKNKPLPKNKRKQDKDVVITIDYDVEPKKNKISWQTKIHNETANVLANDILDDLKTHYPDTIIKKCFCASCSYSMTSSLSFLLTLSMIIFILNLFR